MDAQRVRDLLIQGREIEFFFRGNRYFLAPLYQDGKFSNAYFIFDRNENTVIFTGALREILSFEFAPGASFEKAGHLFSLEYVM